MNYNFNCKKCKKELTLSFSMKDDEGRNNARCPECGEKLQRIFTAPAMIVKTTLKSAGLVNGPNHGYIVKDGEPIKINFIDHGDRSGLPENSLIRKKFPGARVDEKTGKVVVDVLSNVPDPLGAMDRAKAKGDASVETKKVNRKVKVRN